MQSSTIANLNQHHPHVRSFQSCQDREVNDDGSQPTLLKEGSTKKGAIMRLEKRLGQFLRRQAGQRGPQPFKSEAKVTPLRHKHHKVSGGYLIVSNAEDESNCCYNHSWMADKFVPENTFYNFAQSIPEKSIGRGDSIAAGDKDLTASSVYTSNSEIMSYFQRFYVDIMLSCLPTCVEHFEDSGIVSCNVIQLLSSLDVKIVFGTGESSDDNSTISNGRSGRELFFVEANTGNWQVNGDHPGWYRDLLTDIDIESILLAELVDSPVLLNFIYRHGNVLDVISRSN